MSTQTIFTTLGTSKTIYVSLVQKASATSPGDPITGLAYNTSGLAASYVSGQGGAPTPITLATQTATGAYSSGGFVEVDSVKHPGLYRFDPPNACVGTATRVYITFTGAASLATHHILLEVDAFDRKDGVRMGLTAFPNVASGAAGALLVDGIGTAAIANSSGKVLVQSGTGAGQISMSAGVVDVNIVQALASAIIASGGLLSVNVTQFGGSAGTFAAGIPSVDLKTWRGVQPNNLVTNRVDVTVGALQAAVIAASNFAADAIDSNALATTAVTEIVNAIKAMVVESNGSITLGQATSIMLAVLAGVTSSGGNTLKDPSGTSTRVAATIDASNNRTAMSLNPST